jgi:hypothetical protein
VFATKTGRRGHLLRHFPENSRKALSQQDERAKKAATPLSQKIASKPHGAWPNGIFLDFIDGFSEKRPCAAR